MVQLRVEEVVAIRRAITTCASELMAAVNCEDRFNAMLIDDTISTLADVIRDVHDDLVGNWFSARVRIPKGAIGMLTTKASQRVSN